MSAFCAVPGCHRRRASFDLCGLHYQRATEGTDMDRPVPPEPEWAHGRSAYIYWGCRCPECTAAASSYTARYRKPVEPDEARCLCGCGLRVPRTDAGARALAAHLAGNGWL